MTTVARLSADLVANSSSFESSLKRANSAMSNARQSWDSALGRANRSFSNFDSHVRRSVGSIVDLKTQLGGIATLAASALSVQKIIQYSDTWKQLEGRLTVATGSMEKAADAQRDLFAVAQRNSAPLKDVVDAYANMSLVLTENQKKQFDLVKVTDLLSKTLLISGTNAAGAATFFQQFGQAASSDFKAIGQEIQTFQDQNSFFVKVLKDNLNLGGQSLKQFAADGKLSFADVANAVVAAEGTINEAMGNTQMTVGRALTQLDNAFLQFIGQGDIIKNGTSSIAAAISGLAANFDILGKAVLAVAGYFTFRLVAAFVAAQSQALAYQLTLARMAGVSAAAASSTLGLGAAMRGLGLAFGALGGPLGIAVIAVLTAITLHTNRAIEAESRYNEIIGEVSKSFGKYADASEEAKNKIIENANARIRLLQTELASVEKLVLGYASLSENNILDALGTGVLEGAGKLGIGKAPSEILAQYEIAQKKLAELQEMRAELLNPPKFQTPSASGGSSKTGGSKKDSYKDVIDNLKEESAQLKVKTDLYGEKASAVDRAQQALKIQNQLAAAGVKITKEQQAEIDKYLTQIEKQNVLLDKQDEIQKNIEEKERDRREAINQLGSTFESAFEKAIMDGEKLGDVLQGLLDDILRIITRVTITAPIGNAITDIFTSSTSGGGGILDGLFSSFPSFATGSALVPRDMTARVHRGEAIIPASQTKSMMDGGDLVVNIFDSNGSKTSTTRQPMDNAGELTIMLDQAMAQNITTPGTRTAEALKAMNNRATVRR